MQAATTTTTAELCAISPVARCTPLATPFASSTGPDDVELIITPVQGPSGSSGLRGLFSALSQKGAFASLRRLGSALRLGKAGRRSRDLNVPSASDSAHACSAHGGFLQCGSRYSPDPVASQQLRHAASAIDIDGEAAPHLSANDTLLKVTTAAARTGAVCSPAPASPVPCTSQRRLTVRDAALEEARRSVLQLMLSAPDRSLNAPCGSSVFPGGGVQLLELGVWLSAPLTLKESLGANTQAPTTTSASPRPQQERPKPGCLLAGVAAGPRPASIEWPAGLEGGRQDRSSAGEAEARAAPMATAAAEQRHCPVGSDWAGPQQPCKEPRQLQARRSIETGSLVSMARTVPNSMWRATWSMDDYAVTRRLFKGSKTAVYKAVCKRSALPVALKIYFLDRIPGNTLHQIAREIQIQINLAHKSILGLYGAFQDSKRLVLVMELAGRGDLHRLHAAMERPLSEEQLRGPVMEPLLDALAHLHSRGVCHRDIKPENLLFTADWALRLADFGVAINILEERAVTRAGTADYMAPEVERCPLKAAPSDNKDDASLAYTIAADVWSVGILAYEMLVGFPPVLTGAGVDDSDPRVAASPQLSFPASVSAVARNFITAALAVRPEDRPTVHQLRAHPWMTGAARGGEKEAAQVPTARGMTCQ